MRKLLQTTAVLLLFLFLVATGTGAYFLAKDYSLYFADRKGELVDARVEQAGEDSSSTRSWLTLQSSSGLRVDCGMLVPRDAAKRYPVIILLGGKATGKYAIDYAIGIDDVIIIAPDYPYNPKDRYTVMEFLSDVPAMRTALLDMVPSVMLLTDYLTSHPNVDTTRIVLLGYSFGAPLVPPILANDRRAALAALVYGGGDVRSLIRHNVRRYEGAILSEIVAQLGGLLLRPLEPLRYVAAISPKHLIMINGTEDEQIPRANAELLYEAAREPKRIIWIESRHVHPRNEELTRKIIATLEGELTSLGILGQPD